ncbi:MAG: TolC family protein [Deltaproteobacteria bacterium]
MKKQIISLLSALVFIISICSTAVLAEEAKKTQAAKPVVMEMTLQEALKYAGEHNSTIRDLKKLYDDYFDTYYEIEKRTMKAQNSQDKTFDMERNPMSTAAYIDPYELYKGYTLEKAGNTKIDLLKAKEAAEQGIYYGIEKLVYDIDKTVKDIEYYNNTKKKLEKDVVISQLMLKLKMVTSLQVSKSKLAVSQMNSTIKLYNDILTSKKNALKGLLGVDRNTDVKVKIDKAEYKPVGEINLEDLKKQALEKRADAVKAVHTLRSKEIGFLVADFESKAIGFNAYNNARTAYQNEKADCQGKIDDIKFNIGKVYDALITSQNTYIDALESFNNTNETHKINKLKYEKGMLSTVEIMGSELVYQKAQIDLEKALRDNILANERFVLACTIGDPEAVTEQ